MSEVRSSVSRSGFFNKADIGIAASGYYQTEMTKVSMDYTGTDANGHPFIDITKPGYHERLAKVVENGVPGMKGSPPVDDIWTMPQGSRNNAVNAKPGSYDAEILYRNTDVQGYKDAIAGQRGPMGDTGRYVTLRHGEETSGYLMELEPDGDVHRFLDLESPDGEMMMLELPQQSYTVEHEWADSPLIRQGVENARKCLARDGAFQTFTPDGCGMAASLRSGTPVVLAGMKADYPEGQAAAHNAAENVPGAAAMAAPSLVGWAGQVMAQRMSGHQGGESTKPSRIDVLLGPGPDTQAGVASMDTQRVAGRLSTEAAGQALHAGEPLGRTPSMAGYAAGVRAIDSYGHGSVQDRSVSAAASQPLRTDGPVTQADPYGLAPAGHDHTSADAVQDKPSMDDRIRDFMGSVAGELGLSDREAADYIKEVCEAKAVQAERDAAANLYVQADKPKAKSAAEIMLARDKERWGTSGDGREPGRGGQLDVSGIV